MAPIFVGSNNEDSRIRSNRIGFAASTADPGSLVTGDAYYNSTDNQLKIYDGSALSPVSGGGGTVELVATGSLANGQTVIIKSDGTATGIATTGQSASVGTPASVGTYDSGVWEGVYESVNKKVIIVYKTSGGAGSVIIGDVSGTTLTMGTPATFESGSTDAMSIAFDPSDQKFVIVYRDVDDSYNGKLVLGNWNGSNDVSVGSPVTVDSGGNSASHFSSSTVVYDSSADKVAIFYNWNNEFGGTYVSKYRVGTISGASITLGSATQWDTAWNSHFSSVYDSVNGKIVIAYRNGDNNTGEVIVGEITGSGSGASVTLGSPVSFSSVNTQSPNLAFDPNEGKVAITYRDDSTSVGVAKIGTVSGNSITVGTGTTFGTGDTYYPRVIYETNAKKFVYNYKISAGKEEWYYSVATVDGTTVSIGASVFVAHKTQTSGVVVFDPDEGTLVFGGNFALTSSGQTDDRAVAYKIEYLNTTLTSENFIGFSDAAYTNGQTAKIQIVSSVDDAQTGLTTGSQLYVQKDGSLGTTADTPSVFAGTALSGTEISIKN